MLPSVIHIIILLFGIWSCLLVNARHIIGHYSSICFRSLSLPHTPRRTFSFYWLLVLAAARNFAIFSRWLLGYDILDVIYNMYITTYPTGH